MTLKKSGRITVLARDRSSQFSPLTPALSPLRGEGVAAHARFKWASVVPRPVHLRRRAHPAPERGGGFHSAIGVHRAPSPLNGERAGVRGERKTCVSCKKSDAPKQS